MVWLLGKPLVAHRNLIASALELLPRVVKDLESAQTDWGVEHSEDEGRRFGVLFEAALEERGYSPPRDPGAADIEAADGGEEGNGEGSRPLAKAVGQWHDLACMSPLVLGDVSLLTIAADGTLSRDIILRTQVDEQSSEDEDEDDLFAGHVVMDTNKVEGSASDSATDNFEDDRFEGWRATLFFCIAGILGLGLTITAYRALASLFGLREQDGPKLFGSARSGGREFTTDVALENDAHA
jgi:hypothetical protein